MPVAVLLGRWPRNFGLFFGLSLLKFLDRLLVTVGTKRNTFVIVVLDRATVTSERTRSTYISAGLAYCPHVVVDTL